MRPARAGTEARVWMKRTASTASVPRASSRPTATPRWTSAAAARACTAPAGTTSTGTTSARASKSLAEMEPMALV